MDSDQLTSVTIGALLLVGFLAIMRECRNDRALIQAQKNLPAGAVVFKGRTSREGVPGDVALCPDGRWLFRAHNSVVFVPVQELR